MPADRSAGSFEGFGRSPLFTTTIPSGSATPVATTDLGRNYGLIIVSCTDASGIAAASKLQMKVAEETGATLADLWLLDASAIWQTGTLPTSGSFRLILANAFGTQLIKPVLTVNTTGNVVLNIYGFDPTKQG